jgi:hypothetical protein
MPSVRLFCFLFAREAGWRPRDHFPRRPSGPAWLKPLTRRAHSPRSHAASQRRGQAPHTTRVRSTRHHSQLHRTRSPPCCGGRPRDCAPLVAAMGRHACLAAGAAALRQTTRAEQSGGQPTRARPHPRRQPRASRHPLHRPAASRPGGHGQGAQHPNAAPLRQGGAGRARQTKQEENSGGE